MVFSSLIFLFCYLPLTLLVYYLTPLAWRNLTLMAVNLIFYGWGEPVYLWVMLLSTVIDYTHGILVDRCKRRGNLRGAKGAVISSVVFNLGILGFFKYWNFLAGALSAAGLPLLPEIPGLPLPIGISFYTFQTMSYTIDVYRGEARVQRNFAAFGAYVTLFPQLIAGPILRYQTVDRQLEERSHTAVKFARGVQRFTIGLAKKVLLANNLGVLWEVYRQTPPEELTLLGAWLGIFAFAFQLYFDFSGYSDMAIGLGKLLGFRFPENFRYPYLAKSATEFWRRWHISLGTWFREYLYIPLGGNRGSRGRVICNLLIVWGATGLWHGASWNFLLWGLFYWFWLVMERYVLREGLARLPGWAGHLYGLLLILVGWAIFALEDLSALGGYLAALFGGGGGLAAGTDWFYLREYLPMLVLAALGSTPLAARGWRGLPVRARQVLLPLLLLGGWVLSTAYLVDGTYNPFLYFRF